MSQIKLTLTGSDVEKLGVLVHENVENEITLCGNNIHNAVRKVNKENQGCLYNGPSFGKSQLEYGQEQKFVLWLDASKIDLEKFSELF